MALAVIVDGIGKVSELVHETLSINQSNDGLNSTCEFDLIEQDVVRKDVWTVGITLVEGPEPITDYTALAATKVEVSITDGATVYFAGILSRVATRHMGATEILGHLTPETEVVRCECHDFNALLEESVIDDLEEYGAMTDEELIDDIFAKYVVGIDFATFVDGGSYVFDEISFEGITVRQFLDTICAQSKCVWYVDYSKKLHYSLKEANAPAWHLSDNPDGVNSFAYFDDITKEIDATNLVNRVFVIGGPVSLWFIDHDSIADYGSHRAIVQDTSLIDIDDIEGKGNAILVKFKDPIVTYRLKTYKDGLRAGMHVRVVSAFYNVDKELLINNLVITFPVDGDPVYEITCGGLDSSASGSAQRTNQDQAYKIPDIIPGQLPLASRGWGHNLVFSAVDNDTVEWTAGTINTVGGTDFSINVGNTDDPGAMADVTYVYLDTSISVVDLQMTTDVTAAIGNNRILVAWAKPQAAGIDATFLVFGGEGVGVFVDTANIANAAITAVKAGNTLQGWSHNLAFSATDHDTVQWLAGEIELADGTTYNIVLGDTGNIGDTRYIYLDTGVSLTVLQKSANAADAVGNNKILVAIAHPVAAGKKAMFYTFGGPGIGVSITADQIIANAITANEIAVNTITATEIAAATITTNEIAAITILAANIAAGTITANEIAAATILAANIVADTITANEIAANTITAAELNVATLSAITANMGTLTAGTIQTAAAGNNRVVINIADGIRGISAANVVQFQLDPSDGKAYFGAGAGALDASGLYFTGSGAAGTTRQVRFLDNSAGTHLLGMMYSDWGGGAAKCHTFLTAHRIAGSPWPADVNVVLAAIDSIAGTDVRWTVTSAGAIYSLSCTDFYIFDGTRHTIRLTGGDATFILSDNAGAKEFRVRDSDTVDIFSIDSNGEVRINKGLYVGQMGVAPDDNDIWCDGEISTDGGTTRYHLGGYNATGDVACSGYIDVQINGVARRIMCRT